MHIGEISFCDRIGFNIKSDDIKRKLLEDLEQKIGFKVMQKHHEIYDERNHTQKFNSMPHLLSLRSNGNPYLLYLTKYNFENQCIFIDKKIQHGYFYPRMIMSKLWFDPSLFDNTLIDGEMIKTLDGSWHFVINDVLLYKGSCLEKLNIVKRVEIAYTILKDNYYHDEMSSCCLLYVKKYFHYNEIESMVADFMPLLPYTCRGIYIKPFFMKFRDVLLNFNNDLVKKVTRFKCKHVDGATFIATTRSEAPPQQQLPVASLPPPPRPLPIESGDNVEKTRVFYVRKTNNADVYELFNTQNDLKPHSFALVNKLASSVMMKNLFRDLNSSDKLAMKCEYNDKFTKYAPLQPV